MKMASGLSLSSEVRVFPCPNCKETINTSLQNCPFCSTLIDALAASESAAETSRISQACSDASYLKILLGLLIPAALTIFFPFLGLAGIVGFIFIKYAIPVMTIRWWIKYGRIKTTDPDFSKAKKTTLIVIGLWVVAGFLFHVKLGGFAL
jgi:endogenous inhibitor of DNA gyrase (YacG/DUF329 family)